jgi:hypothetical protein
MAVLVAGAELVVFDSELHPPASAAKPSASGKANPRQISRIALVSSCCRGSDGRRFVPDRSVLNGRPISDRIVGPSLAVDGLVDAAYTGP